MACVLIAAGFCAIMSRNPDAERKRMKNETVNCTHPVPPNRFGIFAMHCRDNVPMSMEALTAIIEGPVAEAEPKLKEELEKLCFCSGLD